jgi:hypothetical protein
MKVEDTLSNLLGSEEEEEECATIAIDIDDIIGSHNPATSIEVESEGENKSNSKSKGDDNDGDC